MEKTTASTENNLSVENVVATAIQIPGVKVSRDAFLVEIFKSKPIEVRNHILETGPIAAGCSRSELKKLANALVNKRTVLSSGASFMAGLPGGFAMAATIPADTLQFFAVALRLAQEISYIYGAEDLWTDGAIDNEKVQNQLILYCGVMFGASGASATVKILSSALAKQALKKIPQKALTKTFYYPIIKSIARVVGAKMTKDIFAKGVSKAIPVIGGVVSGGITFVSMRPMGNRLVNALDEAHFSYSEAQLQKDLNEIVTEYEIVEDESAQTKALPHEKFIKTITEYKKLVDEGVLSEDEFKALKAKLLAEI